MLLIAEKISKKIEDRTVLNEVSFQLVGGEVVSLTGPNGVGKTTLLSILAGDMTFEGNLKMYEKKIGFVGHNLFLFNYLTITEMFKFVREISESEKITFWKSPEELMYSLNIYDYRDVLLKDLSLGTKQKVAMGINLYLNPNILLLDEPFVNLDTNSRINLKRLLQLFVKNQNDRVILLATHSKESFLIDLIDRNIELKMNRK